MVRERRRRSSSSSDDSSDTDHRKRSKKHRSRSPKETHKEKHKRHYEDIKPRIKQEPVSNSESDSSEEEKPKSKHGGHKHNRKHRLKQEVKHEQSGSYEAREREHHHVQVKQEPDSEEEMRQQRQERRQHDQQRVEHRRRQEHEDRREARNRHREGDDSRNHGRNHGQRENRAGRDNRNNIPEHERYGRREEQSSSNTEAASDQPKDAPDFELSGKLTEDTNTYKGVVIKYNEPEEARKPKKRWRLYPFKNDEPMKPYHMHRQSAYLFGRDRIIADIPIDHPSCSKQHAVFQYRMVPYEKPDGRRAFRICPYIIDLESANGTFVNNKRIDDRVYVELMEKDVVKFGFSSREYVLLHDKSSTAEIESDESS